MSLVLSFFGLEGSLKDNIDSKTVRSGDENSAASGETLDEVFVIVVAASFKNGLVFVILSSAYPDQSLRRVLLSK